MKRLNSGMYVVATAMVLFAFQNCSKAQYAASLGNGSLVATDQTSVNLGSNDSGGVVTPQQPSGLYECIVQGHLQNQQIGLSRANLEATDSQSLPDAVCMSKHACLDLVSTKFNVVSAEERDSCGTNPSVVILSDDEIKNFVDQLNKEL